MGAYCMGALMLLLLLGSRDDVPARKLVLFTPPCDFEHAPAFVSNFREGRIAPADAIDETTGLVPESAIRAMFRLLQPTSELVQYVTLWENLWRDEYVRSHRAVNHWAWNHRAMAGRGLHRADHRVRAGEPSGDGDARLGGRAVRLANSRCPTLVVVAEKDEFVPPASAEALPDLLGSDDVEVLRVPGGHAGALMGRPPAVDHAQRSWTGSSAIRRGRRQGRNFRRRRNGLRPSSGCGRCDDTLFASLQRARAACAGDRRALAGVRDADSGSS